MPKDRDGWLTRADAVRLMVDGAAALASVEAAGFRVDEGYLRTEMDRIQVEMDDLVLQMQSTSLWKDWTRMYGRDAKLGNRKQLAAVLAATGVELTKYTATGEFSTDAEVLKDIDHPFVRMYARRMRLHKIRATYLKGILSESVDGYVHPSINLHKVITFRSSCDSPNLQNVPTRDEEMARVIRTAFLPSPGNVLVEVDFGAVEVRVAACYNKDPALVRYVSDPSTDMHRDTASQLFHLPVDYLIEHKAWAKKSVRDWAKNRFVFPEFYGSVYFQCAPHIWKAVEDRDKDGKRKYRLPDGTSIRSHLKRHGIRDLGDCTDPKAPPRPGTFAHHVKSVEDDFWNRRFKVYTEWKRSWYRRYLETGEFRMTTGFRVQGRYDRNQVLNAPIQGAAFHCLLWSLTQVVSELKRLRMRSKVVMQIHDCMVLDVPPAEVNAVLDLCHEVMTERLPRTWRWITVPLETEAEVSPTNWFAKKVWDRKEDGTWASKT